MQLHELIQSMSKAEKRHFKLYVQSGVGKGQSPKYLSLFDLLNQQKYYDEKKVAKKGYTYDDKNILNEKILEALHVFHAVKSVDSELSILLHQCSILYQKSLWNELRKRLKKARKLAKKYERFLYLLEIIRWEKIIADRMGEYDTYLLLIEEQTVVREKMNEEMSYTELVDRIIIILIKDGSLTKPKNRLQIEQLANESLAKKNPVASSVLSQISYHRVKFRYYFHIKENKEKAYFHIMQIVELFDKYNFIMTYEGMIAVYLIALFWQKELSNTPEQALDFTQIIDNLPLQSPHTIYAAYTFGLSDCMRSLNRMAGELIIKKIETENYISQIKLLQQLPLFYNVITFYGIFGEWKKAQIWLNKILSIKRPAVRRDIQISVRFWLLMISYERELNELDKHIQSVQKYLKRANHQSDIQQPILQAFNNLDKATRETERKEIWEKLYNILDGQSDDSITKNIPIRQLKLWCESKIKHTTIAEVIRTKLKK